MFSESAGGTSRRGFLGRAAGAAAAVAGAGVGAGAIARSAAAANGRTYTGGRFQLFVDGTGCGTFGGFDGGNLSNEVLKTVDPSHVVVKQLGKPKYEDCTIQTGSGMSTGFYDWVKASFDHGFDASAQRRASVVVVGSRGEEAARRSFPSAQITQVTFPALDVTSTKVAPIAVTFSSQQVIDRAPSGQPVSGAKQKAWLCSNFRIEIGGMSLSSRVPKIDSFTWKCTILDDGSLGIDMGDLAIHCDVASLPDFQLWLANLQKGDDDERDGSLTIVGGGGVLTVGLLNLGVYALRPDHAPGQLSNGRFVAEMYCEKATWDMKKNV